MIRSPLRAGLALACALSLSACGGGDGDLVIGGQVTGVTKPGLVLTNNGGSDLAINTSGAFRFNDLVETDSRYFIEVKSWPSNVAKKEDCKLTNFTGRAVFNVNNVFVDCTIRKHALGGKILELGNRSGLVLVNGTNRVVIPAGAKEFEMAPVSEDAPYGITILPPEQGVAPNCTVENGSGFMPSGPVENVVVRCTP